MSSVLEIVNQSILNVGESPITQEEYDEDLTKAAKVVSARYPSVKKEALRSYPWRIAERRIRIEADIITEEAANAFYGITIDHDSALHQGDTFRLILKTANDPIDPGVTEGNVYYQAEASQKWTRQYTLPEDNLRIRYVSEIYGDLEFYDYFSDKIHADTAEIFLVYTADIDEQDMDESLASVVAYLLSIKIARFLAVDEDMEAIKVEYVHAFRQAKTLDAQQDASRHFYSTDWLERRLSGSILSHFDDHRFGPNS